MDRPLAGRLILVAEDEPMIALSIAEAFEDAGASVLVARNLAKAFDLIEHPMLTAAIVGFGLSDGDSPALYQHLQTRSIPFVIHSGYAEGHDGCESGVFVPKPASADLLLATVSGLLATGSMGSQRKGALPA